MSFSVDWQTQIPAIFREDTPSPVPMSTRTLVLAVWIPEIEIWPAGRGGDGGRTPVRG